MNAVILFLSAYCWRTKLKKIDRAFLVMKDLKYVEFIEKVYNSNKKMPFFNLKILGCTEKIKLSSYNTGKSYFGFEDTAGDIYAKLIDVTNPFLTSGDFFNAVSEIENSNYKFASPSVLYTRNAHLYALAEMLCQTNVVRQSLQNFRIQRVDWETSISPNATMERFCSPSYTPYTDFSYCFDSFQKHTDLVAVLFFSIIVPFIVYIVLFIMSEAQRQTHVGVTKMFYYVEDVNAFVVAIFLTAFSMEFANGLPSGVKGTRCSEETTGLYSFYEKFFAIFIFLGIGFALNIFSAVVDLVFYLRSNEPEADRSSWWSVRSGNTNVTQHAEDLFDDE
jgi:hypothetical protein